MCQKIVEKENNTEKLEEQEAELKKKKQLLQKHLTWFTTQPVISPHRSLFRKTRPIIFNVSLLHNHNAKLLSRR